MKVLVVDDSKAVHAFLEEIFDGTDTTLNHVFNGQEAIDAVTSNSFDSDVVLLDWEMPTLSGIEALPQLRSCRSHLHILMMTSKNSMADIVEALQKGASDYVIKPFTKDILLAKISQVTGKEVA